MKKTILLVRLKSGLSWHVWMPFYVKKQPTTFSARRGPRTIEIRAIVARLESVLRQKTIHDIFCEMWTSYDRNQGSRGPFGVCFTSKNDHDIFGEKWNSPDRNQGSCCTFGGRLCQKTTHSVFWRSGTRTIKRRALVARLESVLHQKTTHGIFCETWNSHDRNEGSCSKFKVRFTSENDPRHFLRDVDLVRSKPGLSWIVWRPLYVRKRPTAFCARCEPHTIEIRALVARLESVLRQKTTHGIFCEMWTSYDQNQGSRGSFEGALRQKTTHELLRDVELARSK